MLLSLILVLISLTACENRPTQPVAAAEIPPTITPTRELSLSEVAARVCKHEAVPQAAAYVNGPGIEHKIYVIGADGLSHSWNQDLPQNLKAGSVEDLEAVLCIVDQRTVESDYCGTYTDDVLNTSTEVHLGFYAMDLELVAAKTGEVIASEKIFSDLAVCPDLIQSNDYHLTNGVYYGEEIDWDNVWNNYYQDIHLAVANATSIPPTPTPIPLPPGPSVVDWVVEVKDDFSNPDLWGALDPGETISNGVLTWQIKPRQLVYQSRAHDWTTLLHEDTYAHLIVRHTDGSATDAYGLAFRMNREGQLAFLIQDDGTFRIQTEEYYDFFWQTSPAIKPGEWNTLEVIDFQGMLHFYINGTQVYQINEGTGYGQVGLAVIVEENSDSSARSTFEFDEFEVRYP